MASLAAQKRAYRTPGPLTGSCTMKLSAAACSCARSAGQRACRHCALNVYSRSPLRRVARSHGLSLDAEFQAR